MSDYDPWEPLCDLLIPDTDDDCSSHHASVCSVCGAVVLDSLRDRHQQWHRNYTRRELVRLR